MLRKIAKFLFGGGASRVRALLMLQNWAKHRGLRRVAHLTANWISRHHGVYISPHATVHSDVRMPHPTGIVIGDGVRIESNVTIYQHVTLGGARIGDWQMDRYPLVREGATIFAGAAVIGDIEFGAGCTVRANGVVNRSVPAGAIAVGVPAKVKTKERSE